MLSLVLVPLVAVCSSPATLRSWSGEGLERLAPITLKRDARLVYQSKGRALFVRNTSKDPRTDAYLVQTEGRGGSTFLPAGRYALVVTGYGSWRLEVKS